MTDEPNGSCPWCGGIDRNVRPMRPDLGVPCTNTWHTVRHWRIEPTSKRTDPPGLVQPELPYGGDFDPNSGFAGSSTSEARAREADESGVTANRQRQTIFALADAGSVGLTWRELADVLGLHHGSASSVLSVLHKVGRIDRLAETRRRCKVYVLPHFTGGREIESHGRTAATGLLKEAVEVLRVHGPCMFHRETYPEPDCTACRGAEVVAEYDRRTL